MVWPCLFVISSCTYGYTTDIEVSRNEAYSYRPHTRFVEVYFDDHEPARHYKQIAMIEADGSQFEDNTILLEKLRKRAQRLGADAVIKIHKSTTQRQSGEALSEFLFDGEPETYTAAVLSGVAIKYIDSLQTGEWQ
jgi:hypothetical protein